MANSTNRGQTSFSRSRSFPRSFRPTGEESKCQHASSSDKTLWRHSAFHRGSFPAERTCRGGIEVPTHVKLRQNFVAAQRVSSRVLSGGSSSLPGRNRSANTRQAPTKLCGSTVRFIAGPFRQKGPTGEESKCQHTSSSDKTLWQHSAFHRGSFPAVVPPYRGGIEVPARVKLRQNSVAAQCVSSQGLSGRKDLPLKSGMGLLGKRTELSVGRCAC